MQRRFCKVFEDQDKIELLQSILHTFQRRNFDISEGDNKEGRVSEMDKALGGGLQAGAGAERDTLERKFSEGCVDFQSLSKLSHI